MALEGGATPPQSVGAAGVVREEQVADRHLPRDLRVLHAEPRQVLDHGIVPAHQPVVDQGPDRRRPERFGDGADLEEGVRVIARTTPSTREHPRSNIIYSRLNTK